MRTTPTYFPGLILLALLSGCNVLSGQMSNSEGMAYYHEGDYAMAREHFKRASADEPWNADYIHNLASAMRKQGDVAEAERIYRHALEVDPSHHPSYHGLALLMNEQGRQAEAQQLLAMWSDTQPYDASSHVELAWLQREQGDLAAAEQSLQQALRVQPSHPTALAHLGQIYQDSGQSERAVAMYQRSLHSDWYQPQVQSRLASLQQPPSQPGWSPSAGPVLAARPVAHGAPVVVPATGWVATPQVAALPEPVITEARSVASGPVLPTPVTPADHDPAHSHADGSEPLEVEAH